VRNLLWWLTGTPAGRLFLLGIGILGGGFALIAVAVLAEPTLAEPLAAQATGTLLFGRHVAIPAALFLGLSPEVAALHGTFLDVVNLLLTVPLLLLAEEPLRRWIPRLDQWLHREEERAAHRTAQKRFLGLLSLALLSVAPLVPVGAVGAAVVGIFLGYGAVALVGSLVIAAAVANVAWAYGGAWAGAQLAALPPAVPWFLLAGVLAILGVYVLLRKPTAEG